MGIRFVVAAAIVLSAVAASVRAEPIVLPPDEITSGYRVFYGASTMVGSEFRFTGFIGIAPFATHCPDFSDCRVDLDVAGAPQNPGYFYVREGYFLLQTPNQITVAFFTDPVTPPEAYLREGGFSVLMPFRMQGHVEAIKYAAPPQGQGYSLDIFGSGNVKAWFRSNPDGTVSLFAADYTFGPPIEEITFGQLPEPATISLLGIGLAIAAARRRCSRRRDHRRGSGSGC